MKQRTTIDRMPPTISLAVLLLLSTGALAGDEDVVARAQVSLLQAIRIAEEHVGAGTAVEAELGDDDDTAVYEVEVLGSGSRHQLTIHGVSGAVISSETKKLGDSEIALAHAMSTAHQSLAGIIAEATSRGGGTPIKGKMRIKDGGLIGAVELLVGEEKTKIDIPAGAALRAEEQIDRDDEANEADRHDDEEEGEGDDDDDEAGRDEDEDRRAEDAEARTPPHEERQPAAGSAPPPADRRLRATEAWSFDREEPGRLPEGWVIRETAPSTKPATWQVTGDPAAPSGPQVLAVTESENYSGTVNLAIFDRATCGDVDISVKLKEVGGREDQGGGPVWRYRDANNYYFCHANPGAGVVRLYKVVDGRRSKIVFSLFGKESGRWHDLRITMIGDTMDCYLDGTHLVSTTDDTHRKPGGVGLSTLADAVTSFDDFVVHHSGD